MGSYKEIYDKAAKEIKSLDWWEFRKIKVLRDKIRWASHHYSLNIKKQKDEQVS